MATSYRLDDKTFYKFWLVISQDAYVCNENAGIIQNIAFKNGVDPDSVTYISDKVINWAEVGDLVRTPGFFGERLVMIKDKNFDDFSDEDIDSLASILDDCDFGHIAMVLTYKDRSKLNTKRYKLLVETAEKHGLSHIVSELDEKFLRDMIIRRARSQGTVFPLEIARNVVQDVGKDVGFLINETDKYCAACDYTEITKETVENIGCKTVEASVFDMITLICRRQPVKAIEKLNTLLDLRVDEMSVLGAITSGFVDMYRCKTRASVGVSYNQVRDDFEKKSNPYRYKKAMSNASAFTIPKLESILSLLLQADINSKKTGADKVQILKVLVTQIMITGFAR